MTIEIPELLKDLNLTEDQQAALSTVQEKFQTVYEQETTGLKSKNQELIGKLKELKEKVPENIDLDGYQEYIQNKQAIAEEKRKAEEERLIASQNWEKLKDDMLSNHEQTLNKIQSEKDNQINSLRQALDNELIENVAMKEIDKAEGSHVLLMPHIKNSIKTVQNEDGSFGVTVVDQYGDPRMNAETGEPLTVAELVSEFQANEAFAGAFPIQNRGSNSTVTVGGKKFNSTNNPFDKKSDSYSLTEQARLNKTNPALAKSLKEAASR